MGRRDYLDPREARVISWQPPKQREKQQSILAGFSIATRQIPRGPSTQCEVSVSKNQ